MSEPVYVYVVEQGCYSDRGVLGVYATPEAAMEALPITEAMKQEYPDAAWRPCAYSELGYMWSNGCDWGLAMDITRYELQAAPPAETPEQP